MTQRSSAQTKDIFQRLEEGLRKGAIVVRRASDVDPSIQASRAYAELKPTARQQLDNRQFIDHLKSEAEELRARIEAKDVLIATMRRAEVESAQLKVIHKSARWVGGVCAVAVAVGGGLVSMYASSNEDLYLGIGWGLIIIASIVQLGKSLIDF